MQNTMRNLVKVTLYIQTLRKVLSIPMKVVHLLRRKVRAAHIKDQIRRESRALATAADVGGFTESRRLMTLSGYVCVTHVAG